MNEQTIAVLWRRLDVPGHDACRFVPSKSGWTLHGSAVFLEGEQVCQLRYEVRADSAFQAHEAVVAGWVGETEVDLRVCAIGKGGWTANGAEQPQLAGCVDLDLGFTPAMNFLPVRRPALRVGDEAQAPAAYLAFPRLTFEVLPQRYKRISGTEYEYQSPSAGYSGTLELSAQGVVVSYPGLLLAEGK